MAEIPEATSTQTPLPQISQNIIGAPQVSMQNQDSKQKSENAWLNPLLIVLAVSTVVVVLILGFAFLKDKNSFLGMNASKTTPTPTPMRVATMISGIIAFQGYAKDEAYLVIVERSLGKKEFKSVVTGLIPQTGLIPWVWKDATSGTGYELKAQLKVRGETVQESAVVAVSAPAQDVSLTLISEQDPPVPQQASISGVVHLDGFIPSGSSLSVQSRISGKGNYSTVVSGFPAQDNTNWSWTGASLGETYDISIILKNASGVAISSDPGKTITAPSAGLLFDVSSDAQPPVLVITGISGSITVNGSIPTNSYMTLGIRQAGASTFSQVGGNIAVRNGVSWSYANTQSGTDYDVQTYLWVNGKPYAESNILNLTAPSTNNILTVNAQQQLSSPSSDSINISCNGQQGGAFQATINYNTNASLQNAQSYNLVVTLASQGNQVLNTSLTPANPGQSQSLTTSYIFTPGTTYYAQYAYASSLSNTTFSPLSPAIQFSCR